MSPVFPLSSVGANDMPTFITEQGHLLSADCLKIGEPTTSTTSVGASGMRKIASRSTVADEEDKEDGEEYDKASSQAEIPAVLCGGDAAEAILLPAATGAEACTEAEEPHCTHVEAYTEAAEPALSVEVSEQTHCHLENASRVLQHLYLGGKEAVQDSKSLELQGICAVVCCSRDYEIPDEQFVPGLEYLRVDVEDVGREPLGLFFPETTEFIHKQILQERAVLVHCKAGVSRSASVILAYLMEYCAYSLKDAFLMMVRLRPLITPNPGFMQQLATYEKEVCSASTPSIDMRKYVSWIQAAERCPEPDLTPDC